MKKKMIKSKTSPKKTPNNTAKHAHKLQNTKAKKPQLKRNFLN